MLTEYLPFIFIPLVFSLIISLFGRGAAVFMVGLGVVTSLIGGACTTSSEDITSALGAMTVVVGLGFILGAALARLFQRRGE